MNAPLYHKKLEKALDLAGGLYTLEDILERISDGRMQSWAHNNSWIVTQIAVYPRRRVLECVAACGDLGDARRLNAKIVTFAREMDIDLISAFGRLGWAREAERNGWRIKARSYLYHREL